MSNACTLVIEQNSLKLWHRKTLQHTMLESGPPNTLSGRHYDTYAQKDLSVDKTTLVRIHGNQYIPNNSHVYKISQERHSNRHGQHATELFPCCEIRNNNAKSTTDLALYKQSFPYDRDVEGHYGVTMQRDELQTNKTKPDSKPSDRIHLTSEYNCRWHYNQNGNDIAPVSLCSNTRTLAEKNRRNTKTITLAH